MYAIIGGITWQIQKYRNVDKYKCTLYSVVEIGQDVLLLYHDPH